MVLRKEKSDVIYNGINEWLRYLFPMWVLKKLGL